MTSRKIRQARPQGVRESGVGLTPEMERLVSELDARWRARNKNQVEAINRLLMDSSYDHEMDTLHEKLARGEACMDAAMGFLRESGVAATNAQVSAALKCLAQLRTGR